MRARRASADRASPAIRQRLGHMPRRSGGRFPGATERPSVGRRRRIGPTTPQLKTKEIPVWDLSQKSTGPPTYPAVLGRYRFQSRLSCCRGSREEVFCMSSIVLAGCRTSVFLMTRSQAARLARKCPRAFFPSLAASAMLSKKTGERSTGADLPAQ